ncbi:MAG: AAA family ATPase, partial [Ktedonobacteraceae bacterium]|nr:AAA family ATPase [Ktedonobacteraceae bacterium]
QRLGIAAALLTDPELVLLDEPTNGLDPTGMIEIRKLIQRLAELGKTIFLSSHMLHEVQQVCNRVGILHRGNLIKQGNVGEMLRHQEQVEVRLSGEEETQRARHILQQTRENGVSWLIDAKVEQDSKGKRLLLVNAPADRSAEINAILARADLFAAEIHPRQGSLEDLFLQAMAESPLAPMQQTQEHVGMEALADGWKQEETAVSDGEKRGVK